MPAPTSLAKMPVAVLFTGHFYDQKRRGSFHWLADELVKRGYEVRFITVGYSVLSWLVKDRRLRALGRTPTSGWRDIRPGLKVYFKFTLFHPVHLRKSILNTLAEPIFRLFPLTWWGDLRQVVQGADLLVVESGAPVMLANSLRRLSNVRMVYRANDDIRLLNAAPSLIKAEESAVPLFDRVSVASPHLAARFSGRGKVGLDPMGVNKADFDVVLPDPYKPRWQKECVCAGTTQFDQASVLLMAKLRPEWRFHVLGRLAQPLTAPNIVTYGEMPFREIVPFVKHADIGLAPYINVPGVEYQTHHSNRVLQYLYLRLPVLGPARMTDLSFPSIIGYEVNNVESMEGALKLVEGVNREEIACTVNSWDALCDGIIGAVER